MKKIGTKQRVANKVTDRFFSQFSFSRSPLSLLVTLHCIASSDELWAWLIYSYFSVFQFSFLFFFSFFCYNIFAIRCM